MINKEEYLNTVCSEIKFRAARKVLREELAAHIVDKKAELEKGGASDPEAQALVVMGDAKAVGRALNAVHRPRTEWGEIVCVLLLSAAGFIAFKAGSTYNPDEYSSMSDMLKSKFINNLLPGTVAGLSALVCSYFLDYKWLLRLRHVFFFAGLAYTSAYMMQTYEQGIIVSVGLLTQSGVIAISALFFLLGTIGFIEHSSRKGVKGMIGAAAACAVSIVVMYLLSFFIRIFPGCRVCRRFYRFGIPEGTPYATKAGVYRNPCRDHRRRFCAVQALPYDRLVYRRSQSEYGVLQD